MVNVDRRAFLQLSAGATLGGVAMEPGSADRTRARAADSGRQQTRRSRQDEGLPEYANWVSNLVLDNNDSVRVSSYHIPTLIELQARTQQRSQTTATSGTQPDSDTSGETDATPDISYPPMSIGAVLASFTASSNWFTLSELGIANQIIGQELPAGGQIALPDGPIPARRTILYDDIQIYLGSFDTTALEETATERTTFQVTDAPGVYAVDIPGGQSFITWTDSHVIIAPDKRTVTDVQGVGVDGAAPRRHETNEAFNRLVREIGTANIVEIVQGQQQEFGQLDADTINVDAFQGAQGFAIANNFNLSEQVVGSTTLLYYQDEAAVSQAPIDLFTERPTDVSEQQDPDEPWVTVEARHTLQDFLQVEYLPESDIPRESGEGIQDQAEEIDETFARNGAPQARQVFVRWLLGGVALVGSAAAAYTAYYTKFRDEEENRFG